MGVSWNDAKPDVFVVPRLENHLIDELFYQEDEIGEMRHTAFMIECGLEEDPPDGPDVPPIPWKKEELKKATEEAEAARKKEIEKRRNQRPKPQPRQPRKTPPKRTYSMDGGLEDLEENLPEAAKANKPEPMHRRVVFNHSSGTLRRPSPRTRRKAPPSRHMSVDARGKSPDANLSLGFARSEKRPISGNPRKLAVTKSGSLLEMRTSLKKSEDTDGNAPTPSPRSSPRRASKLVATKSGNLHGMRKALQKSAASPVEGIEEFTVPTKKREPTRGSLVVTKSGSAHGLRRLQRRERKDSKDCRSVSSTSTGDSFLNDLELDSDTSSIASEISIETDASDNDDQPKIKSKNGEKTAKEILQEIRKKKEQEKKKKKDHDDGGMEKKRGTKPVRRFKVPKANLEDLPPAFRTAIAER